MTAVQWLVKIYLQTNKIDSFDIEQAKEMEKQQIIKTGLDCGSFIETEDMEKYYNETYGSKGSDELSKVEENTSFDTSSQIEISDEEIEDIAWEKFITDSGRFGFIEGAKWYREQLKSRQ